MTHHPRIQSLPVSAHKLLSSVQKLFISAAAISVLCCLVSGCRNPIAEAPSNGTGQSRPDKSDERTARQIVDWLKSSYSTMENYSDDAKLHVSYRIDGQLMEEHHPWQVVYQRPRKLSAKLFNARIKSDADMLTCFVYDFPSGNLDNQFLVLDSRNKLPINQLLTDSIARHFVAGQTELPINGNRALAFEAFVPPTLGLLEGEPDFKWLDSSEVERLNDLEIDERLCYQVALRTNELVFKILIDQETGLLLQIEYPIELLDEQLQQAEQVKDLRLFARFTDASTKATTDQQTFAAELPEAAKTVSRFVAVPEKFPCDSVGTSLANLKIKDMGGFPVNAQLWKGKVTTLLWMDEAIAAFNADELNELASSFDKQEFSFSIVLIGGLTNNRNIAKLVANDINVLMDNSFAIGQEIGLQTTPAAIVLDRDGRIQFTQSISTWSGWQKKLPIAIKRIRGGDQVASEMRQQYELFLEQYRRRLAESNPFQQVSHAQVKHKRFFDAVKKWHLGSIKLPGNIVRLYGESNSVLVSEGFQSVAIIGPKGNLVSRTRIPVDEAETISIMRVNHGRNPETAFAMFSILSPQLLVLSEAFQKIALLPATPGESQIVDATWIPVAGKSQLAMAMHDRNEIVWGELDGGSLSSLPLSKPATSIAVIDSDQQQFKMIACLNDGSLVAIQSDGQVDSIDLSEQTADLVRARTYQSNANHLAQRATSYVVIGPGASGGWMANGFDSTHARKWRIPIQVQQHENQIQPIAHCDSDELPGGIWAIAGSESLVTLISDDGRFADTIDIGFVPRGIELAIHENVTTLIASGDDGVAAWSISVPNHVAGFQLEKKRR